MGQLSIGDKGNKTLVGQFNFGDFAHFYIGANRGIRYGWQNVGHGLGVGVAPVCAGVLWNVTGTYAAPLLMSLGFSLVGLFSAWLLPAPRSRLIPGWESHLPANLRATNQPKPQVRSATDTGS